MTVIRVSVFLSIFDVLYQIFGFDCSFASWIGSLFVHLVSCWLLAVWLTRRFILPRFPTTDPTGKAVLITGCDHGFGQLAAAELNRQGFHVFAGCLFKEGDGAKELLSKCMHKNSITILQLDVTKEDEVKESYKIVDDVLRDSSNPIQELFALINNAGIMGAGWIEMWEAPKVDDYEKHLAVNSLGMVRVTRMFLPLIRKSKGRIVNVTTIAAYALLAGFSAYSCSKVFSSAFTKILRQELSSFGVTVIEIAPYGVKTPLIGDRKLQRVADGLWNNKTTQEVKSTYAKEYEDYIKLLDASTKDNLCAEPSIIVECIKDAVLSYEPNTIYRPATHWAMDWISWIIYELPPPDWHVSVVNTFNYIRKKAGF